MTSAAATLLLAKTQVRALRHQAQDLLMRNRLLGMTLGGFLVLYAVAAYLMVERGLSYIHLTPLFGPLLTERLVFLMFFFFSVMLVISNATITGMSLFRRREMEWQVALPLPVRSIVVWKTLEGMALASWGLLVLSAPILAALGQLFHSGPLFYVLGLVGLLCLVTISANASTWVLLILVRHAQPWWWRLAAVVGAAFGILALSRFWTAVAEPRATGDLVGSLHKVLRHTEICMHPLLPSTWLAEVLLSSGRGLEAQAGFFLLALLANAFFAMLVTARLGQALFVPAWHRVMSATPRGRPSGGLDWFQKDPPWVPGRLGRSLLRVDRASYALLVKDARTFLREPAQWGQCLLVFGLLLMYSANLRHLGYDLQNPFWTLVVSHLNLLVCCLALSTLTTRFVFPQFSMEGRRLWILGLSPLSLDRVLSLKLRMIGGILALITASLVIVSSLSLQLPPRRAVFFCGAVILQSYGLTALSLSLGTLLPNFREPNPARIISGFGGTVCLISSFMYIFASAVIMALPDAMGWHLTVIKKATLSSNEVVLGEIGAWIGVAILTIVFGRIPWRRAKKSTKKLDYLIYM
jgi:ABC-2 type transport system permease protein